SRFSYGEICRDRMGPPQDKQQFAVPRGLSIASEEGDSRLAAQNFRKSDAVVGLDLDLDLPNTGHAEIRFAALLALHRHRRDRDLAPVDGGATAERDLDRRPQLQTR